MTPLAVRRGAAAVALLTLAVASPLAVRGADTRAIAVGGLTALPGADGTGPNLVKNPNFEAPGGGDLTAWNARAAGPWTIDRAGRGGRSALRLTAADAQQMVPQLEQTVTLEPGVYTVSGWVRAENLGTKDTRSGVRVCLDARPRFNWWHCTPVARGTADWAQLSQGGIAVSDPGPYKVSVGAYGAPDGSAWFDEISLTARRKPALDVYLLYPNFRGMLFEGRPQVVRVAVGAAQGARVRLALLEEPGGAVARERVVTGPGTVELDAAGLRGNAWLLRAELLDAAGAATARYPDHRIVRVSAKAREELRVWFDERNVLYMDGKPAFVLGLYTTGGYSTSRATYAHGDNGWGITKMSEAPVNMLINYHLGRAPIPALSTYMDELSSRGIRYLQTVNFYYREDPQYKEIDYPAAREGEEALNRWVAKTLSAHPGLAGFYTADERPADIVPRVFAQYRALAAAAPGTVTYAVLGDGLERQAPLWRDAVDVMGLDPYPVVQPTGRNDLAMVGEWTRIGQDAVKGARPVWMVIQYFPLTTAGGWPTAAEIKTMSWMAIIEGARGLLYWSWGEKGLAWVKDPRERERKWADLVKTTKEIHALEPVLLAPDTTVVTGGPAAVRVLGKRGVDGARYVFAYNTGSAPVTATWTLSAPATAVMDLDAQAAGPKIEGNGFAASFGPYEVKRYLIR
ncbi:MAG TPA: carbohydrate binding domain-containing protein [Methylomirabilota bacterium]